MVERVCSAAFELSRSISMLSKIALALAATAAVALPTNAGARSWNHDRGGSSGEWHHRDGDSRYSGYRYRSNYAYRNYSYARPVYRTQVYSSYGYPTYGYGGGYS